MYNLSGKWCTAESSRLNPLNSCCERQNRTWPVVKVPWTEYSRQTDRKKVGASHLERTRPGDWLSKLAAAENPIHGISAPVRVHCLDPLQSSLRLYHQLGWPPGQVFLHFCILFFFYLYIVFIYMQFFFFILYSCTWTNFSCYCLKEEEMDMCCHLLFLIHVFHHSTHISFSYILLFFESLQKNQWQCMVTWLIWKIQLKHEKHFLKIKFLIKLFWKEI